MTEIFTITNTRTQKKPATFTLQHRQRMQLKFMTTQEVLHTTRSLFCYIQAIKLLMVTTH